ncbi:MAG: hypothetical protein AB7U83_22405 [Vicinamibacterales bacterium]
MRRVATFAVLLAAVAAVAPTRGQDRRVVWVDAGHAGLERDLNREAARGLRLAAISDGLPCTVAALQAPARPGAPAAYRVVPERDLEASLARLTADGFVPRATARTVGTRHQVVFERTSPAASADEWQLLAFEKLEDLEGVAAAAAADGFQVRLTVRAPFRSWPGLSEPGLVLAARAAGAQARQSRVLIGRDRNLKDVAAPLERATAEGWSLDGVLTSARDGSRDGRRERVVLILSRGATAEPGAAVTIERQSSFGTLGRGPLLGAGVFWNDYLTAWRPVDRVQVWGSPVSLSTFEANCAGLALKMRLDGHDEDTHDIVALLARPGQPDGYQLLVVTEQRLGF